MPRPAAASLATRSSSAVIGFALFGVLGLGCVFALPASAAPSPDSLTTACGTSALRALQASAFPLAGVGIGDRPQSVSHVDSETHPVRVHDTGAAREGQLDLVLAAVDDAWAKQVELAGFATPLPDDPFVAADVDDATSLERNGGSTALDIYLAPLPDGVGALTVSGDDADVDVEHDRRPAFVVLDPNVSDEVLLAATHHEFQHALQFAMDARESIMIFEATAAFFEVRDRPDIDSWQDPLPAFQGQPQAPLTVDGAQFAPFATVDDPRIEYGAALFLLYLDDVWGRSDGTLIADIWRDAQGSFDLQTKDGSDPQNEPDWVDAAAPLTAPYATLLREFATWRALTPPLSVQGDGPDDAYNLDGRAALFGAPILLDTLTGTPRETTPGQGPFRGGCLARIGVAGASTRPLFVRAVSADGDPLQVLSVVVKDGVAVRSEGAIAADGVATHGVQVEAGATVVLLVCDLAPIDADDEPVFASITLTLDDRPIEGAEGEGEGEPGEGEGEEGEGEGEPVCPDEAAVDCGCGCQAMPDGLPDTGAAGDPRQMRKGLYFLGFLVGVFGFVVRYVRHRRRGRMYRRPR